MSKHSPAAAAAFAAIRVSADAAPIQVGQCVRVGLSSSRQAGCFGLVAEVFKNSPEYVGLVFGRNRQTLPRVAEVNEDEVEGWHLSELDLSSVAWTNDNNELVEA